MTPEQQAAVAALERQVPAWGKRLILTGLRGSDAHGTKLSEDDPMYTDDIDTFGVCVQPPAFYLGLDGYSNKRFQHWDTAGERYDHAIYDVRKFVSLLAGGNPNVLGWVFADDSHIGKTSVPGMILRHRRDIFLSRICFTKLAGYAKAQMHKMDRQKYQGYQGAKRKKIVDEVGYDVKHAAHCIRLLNMGIELALTGTLTVLRPPDEAAYLKMLKAGRLTFREVEHIALELFEYFRIAEEKSDLPEKPDLAEINRMLVTIIHCGAFVEL